jgi:hypothetical protein
MKNLVKFLNALERLPSLAAVADEWRTLVGVEFDLIKPFLRVRRGHAESYPRFDGALPYEVVEHGDDDYVGVCRESHVTIRLTKEQLIIHELDRRRFSRSLTAALGIDRQEATADVCGTTLSLGRFISPSQVAYDCILAFPQEAADLDATAARLITEGPIPFLMFVPTRRWLRRTTETRLRARNCAVISLAETVAISTPGSLLVTTSLETALRRALGECDTTQSTLGDTASKNVIRRDGEFWTIAFCGKATTVRNSLGMGYLHYLVLSKRRSFEAIALRASAAHQAAFAPASGLQVADRQAITAYRISYEDLLAELENARRNHDLGREEQVQERIAKLEAELTAATGLGGRLRETHSETEKARKSVCKAIGRTIDRLATVHKQLSRHLQQFVQLGATLRYAPDPDVEWTA